MIMLMDYDDIGSGLGFGLALNGTRRGKQTIQAYDEWYTFCVQTDAKENVKHYTDLFYVAKFLSSQNIFMHAFVFSGYS